MNTLEAHKLIKELDENFTDKKIQKLIKEYFILEKNDWYDNESSNGKWNVSNVKIFWEHIRYYISIQKDSTKISFKGFKFPPFDELGSNFEIVSLNTFWEEGEKREFLAELDFTEAIFLSSTLLDNVTFHKNINFDKAVFKDKANFRNTNFISKVSFNKTIFRKEINFRECLFQKDILFAETRFLKNADFSSAEINGKTQFKKCLFLERINFNNTFFNSPQAIFQDCFSINKKKISLKDYDRILEDINYPTSNKFKAINLPEKIEQWYSNQGNLGDPDARELEKPLVISFEFQKKIGTKEITSFRVKAPSYMRFGTLFDYFISDYNERHPDNQIEFENNQNEAHGWLFYKASKNFMKKHDFLDPHVTVIGNKISEDDIIYCTRHVGPLEFKNEKFYALKKIVQEKECYVGIRADFSNVLNYQSLIFRRMDLTNSLLYQTDLSQFTFSECDWGTSSRIIVSDEINKEATYQGLENLYRQLKKNFDNAKNWEQSGKSYHSEMEMRRLRYKNERGLNSFINYFIYTIYKQLGGYTQDYIKPLKILLVLIFFLFPLFYFLETSFYSKKLQETLLQSILSNNFFDAIQKSLDATFPFFKHNHTYRFWGVQYFQTFLGGILLTFFILALRKRFKQ